MMRARSFILLALLGASTGCPKAVTLKGLCATDADCQPVHPGFICNSDGHCICHSDAACGRNESCNSAGFCQTKVGCDSNADCPAGLICDTDHHLCIDSAHCTKDIQCALGQICSPDNFQCVTGCADNNDCQLGQVCRPCEATDTDCPAHKVCKLGPCDDQSICPFAYACVSSDPNDPKAEKTCQKDTRGPFCDVCTEQPGSQQWCKGAAANFCLIDSTKQFGSFYCGVDCAAGQTCPNGFRCDDVEVLTQNPCTTNDDCRPNAASPCNTDADCATNTVPGRCNTVAHRCAPYCIGAGEGTVQAYCSCVQDSDCPHETCNAGNCSISGRACAIDAQGNDPCQTHPIFCVKYPTPKGPIGACRIGRNCAPVEGVTCDDVRNQKVP